MAHRLADRVRETSSTIGTGAFTLTGAVTGFDTFASVMTSNGDTTWYCAQYGAEWEVGLGTRSSADILARTTVLSSSNADALVNFTAPPFVFITLPAAIVPYLLDRANHTGLQTITVNSASPALTVTNNGAGGGVALTDGTANGVAYLDGSKVLTTGSALTFDGVNLVAGGSIASTYGTADGGSASIVVRNLNTHATSIAAYKMQTDVSGNVWQMFARNNAIFWGVVGLADYMTLSATGLAVTGSIGATGNISTSASVHVPADTWQKVGPSASVQAGLRFDASNRMFLDSDGAMYFRTNGASGFTTVGDWDNQRLAVTGSISATDQVAASAFATTGYNASSYSTKLLLAGSSTADNFAVFIATNGAGRTYYMGPGAGDGAVTSFALYDNTSGAVRWRSTTTGFDVTGSISATGQIVSQDSLRVAKAGSDTFGAGPYLNLSNVAGTVGVVQQLNAAGGLNWYDAAAASSPIMKLKTTGVLNLPNMPTSSAGLVAGDLWSDGGTIKIV